MEKLPALVFIFIEIFSKDIKIGLIIVLENFAFARVTHTQCKIRTLSDKTFELGINGTDKQYLNKDSKRKIFGQLRRQKFSNGSPKTKIIYSSFMNGSLHEAVTNFNSNSKFKCNANSKFVSFYS